MKKNIFKNKRRKKIVFILIPVFLLFITLFGILFKQYIAKYDPENIPTQTSAEYLKKLAQNTIKTCSSFPVHQVCYDKEVPKLMDTISMKDAFSVTRLIQQEDKTYYWCHVLSHNIGEKEYAKDPSRWKEVAMECPNDICSNGCIHGVIQSHFRNVEVYNDKQLQDIKSVLASLCEKRTDWNPTNNEQASCYHGIGHIGMFVTNGDVQKSIALCTEIALKNDGRDFTRTCYEGVFMQIYQPREPEDIALVKNIVPKKDTVQSFCGQFNGYKGVAKETCTLESWPLFDPLIKTEDGIEKFCSYATDPTQKRRCYEKAFFALMSMFEFDTQKMESFCSDLHGKLISYCFSDTVSRMVATDSTLFDEAINVCNTSEKFTNDHRCFNALVSNVRFVFHNNTAEINTTCNLMPNPWKEKCLKEDFEQGLLE